MGSRHKVGRSHPVCVVGLVAPSTLALLSFASSLVIAVVAVVVTVVVATSLRLLLLSTRSQLAPVVVPVVPVGLPLAVANQYHEEREEEDGEKESHDEGMM